MYKKVIQYSKLDKLFSEQILKNLISLINFALKDANYKLKPGIEYTFFITKRNGDGIKYSLIENIEKDQNYIALEKNMLIAEIEISALNILANEYLKRNGFDTALKVGWLVGLDDFTVEKRDCGCQLITKTSKVKVYPLADY